MGYFTSNLAGVKTLDYHKAYDNTCNSVCATNHIEVLYADCGVDIHSMPPKLISLFNG